MFRPKTLVEVYNCQKYKRLLISTHNFLDVNKAKKFGLHLSSTCPLQVDIAGGAQLTSKQEGSTVGNKEAKSTMDEIGITIVFKVRFEIKALMNSVFKNYLRKFILVFFDDILVYSSDLETHAKHLEVVLQLLRKHILFSKQSKCVFGTKRVDYLGHVITGSGVATDETNIEAMKQWPIPKTNASGEGIGAVLKEGGHPIAYFCKTLSLRHHTLSTYENELLTVIQALHKWRGYLLDIHFIIKTNHFSLKYLLEQRITIPNQMKWLPKLVGLDYEIIYKKGSENRVVDALSRVDACGQLLQMVLLSTVSTDLLPKIAESNDADLGLSLLTYFHYDSIGGHSVVAATT
nr:putative retroelement Pol polyprotein [Tanacetum cinerariifolium]